MTYDSTLGYADHIGFRCGTCHEYPAFDAVDQKLLSLKIRPLIVMECSALDDRYMALNSVDAYEACKGLKDKCKAVSGCFTLLWHNSHLLTQEDQDLFVKLLKA